MNAHNMMMNELLEKIPTQSLTFLIRHVDLAHYLRRCLEPILVVLNAMLCALW